MSHPEGESLEIDSDTVSQNRLNAIKNIMKFNKETKF